MVRMTAATCGCRFDAARMASACSLSACFNGASSNNSINASSSARDLSFERFGARSSAVPDVHNIDDNRVAIRAFFVRFIIFIIRIPGRYQVWGAVLRAIVEEVFLPGNL